MAIIMHAQRSLDYTYVFVVPSVTFINYFILYFPARKDSAFPSKAFLPPPNDVIVAWEDIYSSSFPPVRSIRRRTRQRTILKQ